MELKNYSIEATGSLYCSESFASICVDGQSYGIEKTNLRDDEKPEK